jgi:hypothetical protein
MAIKSNMQSLVPRREQYKKVITLMSHGFSNPTAWPDGSLTVYPWDSEMDAYLLDASRHDNPTTVLFDLLGRCCNLNGGKVDEFVADEVNVVLLVSRALASDNTITYQSRCPFCGTRRVEKIKVPDELQKVGEKSKDYTGTDLVTLPQTKEVVAITPLLVRHERLLASRPAEEKAQINDVEMRTMLGIVSINDSKPDTAEELVRWVRALPPTDIRLLTEQQKALSPHLNTLLPHTCENPVCRQDFSHLLTFDQDFFRPAKPTR